MESFSWLFEYYAVTMRFLSDLTIIAATVAAVFSVLNWRQDREKSKRGEQDIKVYLRLEGATKRLELPLAFKRRDFTRGELLGRINMFTKKQGQRFDLEAQSRPEFFSQINEIASGRNSELTIECSAGELEQFHHRVTDVPQK